MIWPGRDGVDVPRDVGGAKLNELFGRYGGACDGTYVDRNGE